MAVRWSAASQYYTRAIALGTVTQFTVTCWARIVNDRNTFTTFWALDNGTTADAWAAQTLGDGTTFSPGDETSNRGAGIPLSVGVWYFIGVAINGANGLVVVRAAGATTSTTDSWTNGSPSTNMATLRVGDSPWGSPGEWPDGNMAAFKLWTGAALTQAQMEQEALSYQPERTANLTTWYPFVQAGTTDYSGNGNTLSGGAGAATADGPPIRWSGGRTRTVLPAGPTVVLGLAALSASGTLTGSATNTVPASATLSASGTAAAKGLQTAPAAAALSASGTLAAAGTRTVLASAALSATGTLAATPLGGAVGAASLTATGSLSAAGLLTVRAAAALTASGSLTATPLGGVVQGAAALQASAGLTANGTRGLLAAAALSASGTLAASGLLAVPVSDVRVTRLYGGWAAAAPSPGWSSTGPGGGWSVDEPEPGWLSSEPGRGWSVDEPH